MILGIYGVDYSTDYYTAFKITGTAQPLKGEVNCNCTLTLGVNHIPRLYIPNSANSI